MRAPTRATASPIAFPCGRPKCSPMTGTSSGRASVPCSGPRESPCLALTGSIRPTVSSLMRGHHAGTQRLWILAWTGRPVHQRNVVRLRRWRRHSHRRSRRQGPRSTSAVRAGNRGEFDKRQGSHNPLTSRLGPLAAVFGAGITSAESGVWNVDDGQHAADCVHGSSPEFCDAEMEGLAGDAFGRAIVGRGISRVGVSSSHVGCDGRVWCGPWAR